MRAMSLIAASVIAAALIATAHAAGKALYKTQDCSKLTVQMELDQCADANAQAADAALNVVYKQLLKQDPDAGSQAGLKDSERAWVAYRDKECAREVGPQDSGGSIWPMEMSNCLEDKTGARIRELRKSLSAPDP